MSCELCGGGDLWIKTCLTLRGSRLLVCDPCYLEPPRLARICVASIHCQPGVTRWLIGKKSQKSSPSNHTSAFSLLVHD
jgi:ribosome-binding protein aMBF1 (putative translation factor)